MKPYRDKTASAAVSSVESEWKKMCSLALRLRERSSDPRWEEVQRAKFTGIFKRLLTDPIEEIKKEVRR